jgi:hypothetical protein
MYPVSSAFRAAVKASHTATLRAEVWAGGQKILDLAPVSGQVVNDARRLIRRTVTAELVAQRAIAVRNPALNTYADLLDFTTYAQLAAAFPTYGEAVSVASETTTWTYDPLVPGSTGTDALAPYGNELRVWRGIRVQVDVPSSYAQLASQFTTYAQLAASVPTYGSLTESETLVTVDEEVPLGVFILTEVKIDDTGAEVRISIQGEDRARRISRNRWTSPYRVASGTNAITAIIALLQDRWDDIEFVATTTTETVGGAVFGQETDNDPWKDAQKLADAAGLEVYFDGQGRCVIAAVPSVEDATPDFVFEDGEAGVLLATSRSANANTTYNGVIATGEGTNSDTPARGEAWDDNPSSPTYRYGPFGQVPRFFSSSLMTTDAQCQSAAESILRKVTGLSEALEWSIIPDPSVEAGDVARVTSTATRIAKTVIIDAVTIPLSPTAAMPAIGRTVRVEADT